jgi:hypothetical protein
LELKMSRFFCSFAANSSCAALRYNCQQAFFTNGSRSHTVNVLRKRFQ